MEYREPPSVIISVSKVTSAINQQMQEYIDEQINRPMDNIYHKLNKKLDALINETNTKHSNNENDPKFQPRLINITKVKYTKEQVQTLSIDPNYAVELEPKQYIKELIIDTENAISRPTPFRNSIAIAR